MKFELNSALLIGAFCVFLCGAQTVRAQENTTLDSLYAELDLLFANDSLSENLFADADSLLKLMNMRFHSLSIRGSYTSDVLTSGRDLGYSQNGWITGLSYYHPSGFYGEATGYINSAYSPQYYLTDLGLGYLFNVKKWMFQAGHNFLLFDDNVDWIFNKNVQASGYYQSKRWEAGLDYRYLYGKESAHRITASAASRLSWETNWIDRITLIPSVSMQWGNSNIIYFRQSETPLSDLFTIIRENEAYPNLEKDQMFRLAQLLQKERYLMATRYLLEQGYALEDINSLILDFEDTQLNASNSFGLMNIALNLGVSLSENRWNLYVNYSYNFPQALPGETYDYENNDYLSLSMFYTLIWTKNKKSQPVTPSQANQLTLPQHQN